MKRGKRLGAFYFICFVFFAFAAGCATNKAAAAGDNRETKDLREFVSVLEAYRNGVLANQNNGKIRTQIITFSFAEGNRAYFCTTSDKPLYTQLADNPSVSYCTFPENFEPVLSINGNVVFVEDGALKERALETNDYAKRNFKSIDNPLLKVFYIDVEEIETYGSEGANVYAAKR